MLLQRLREYSERLDSTPPMYLSTPIRYLIELDRNGRLLSFVPTSGEGGKHDRGKRFLAPHVLRSSGVVPKLLADNGEYVLGIAREASKPARVRQSHEAFVKQIRACAEATQEPAVQAVARFLETWQPRRASLPEDFTPADNLTFSVDGSLPIELESVRRYWATTAAPGDSSTAKRANRVMQCLICGQMRPAVRRLPFKIKGIRGGQPSGMALISANVAAFESYGLRESLIAPTCQECGERFTKAANALIQGENTHISIGDTSYIFWTREKCPFSPASLLSNPEPAEVRALIQSAFEGEPRATDVDEVAFYATALSASGGRVAVKDWIDTTVGNARRSLARYFALQHMVGPDGTEGRPLGIFALAACTVRDPNRDLPPNVPKSLLDMALKGGPLPKWLLFQDLKRNRAEQRVTRNRAVLIKLVLASQDSTKEHHMIELDANYKNPAYLCGRLLAILETAQRAALPGLNTTLTDRFFGTASSAPASVFGRLVRGSQAHLGKLRRTRRGTYEALQRRLEEVLSALPAFPKTLTLENQGIFSLGYYHQRAADRAAATARKQAATEQVDTDGNGE